VESEYLYRAACLAIRSGVCIAGGVWRQYGQCNNRDLFWTWEIRKANYLGLLGYLALMHYYTEALPGSRSHLTGGLLRFQSDGVARGMYKMIADVITTPSVNVRKHPYLFNATELSGIWKRHAMRITRHIS